MYIWKEYYIGFNDNLKQFSVTLQFGTKNWDSWNKIIYFYSLDLLFVDKLDLGIQRFPGLTIEQTFQKIKKESSHVFLDHTQAITFLKHHVVSGFNDFVFHHYSETSGMKTVSFSLNGDDDTVFYYTIQPIGRKEHFSFKRNWKTCEHGIGDHYNLAPVFFPYQKELIHYIKKGHPKTRLKFLGE